MDARKARAARLVAEDNLTDEQIAGQAKVTDRQLRNWKQEPAFRQAVSEHIAQITEQVLSQGIARLDKRLAAKQDRWRRLQRAIEEQADNPDVKDRPGGKSGFLFHREIPTRFGTIEEYTLQTGVSAEMRALEMDAARDTGQYVERLHVRFDPSALTDEQLEKIVGARLDAPGESGGGAGDTPPEEGGDLE